MHTNILLLYAKYPEPGKVKTRLANDIAPYQPGSLQKSAAIYQAFLKDEIDKFSQQTDFAFCICTNRGCLKDFHKLFGKRNYWCHEDSQGQDLGALMSASFRHAFSQGYRRAIIVGSDVPHIGLAEIRTAFESLQQYDVVLGPDEGGGMYLIGMRQAYDILRQVVWSQGTDFNTVKQRALQQGLRVKVLPAFYDVDHLDDLRKLYHDHRLPQLKHTTAILRRLAAEIF